MLELAFRSLSWLWALHFFAERERRPTTIALARRPAASALDRQLTHVEHNLSHYFSPNTHLLGEALALYVAGRALPELAASGRRASVGRRILLDEIDRGRSPPTAATASDRRTTTATRSTSTCSRSLVARITGDEAAPRFEDAAARLGVGGAAARRRSTAACRTSATTTAAR